MKGISNNGNDKEGEDQVLRGQQCRWCHETMDRMAMKCPKCGRKTPDTKHALRERVPDAVDHFNKSYGARLAEGTF